MEADSDIRGGVYCGWKKDTTNGACIFASLRHMYAATGEDKI